MERVCRRQMRAVTECCRRVTYDMMWPWPTPQAAQMLLTAAGSRWIVVSRTLTPSAGRTRRPKGDLVSGITRLKQQPGADLVILGSGSIVSQLTDARLIDEYQIVVSPIVLGRGRTLFDTVRRKVGLTLKKTRAFKNGNVVLWYEPA